MKVATSSLAVLLAMALLSGEAIAQASPSSATVGQAVAVDGGTYFDLSVPELRSMMEGREFSLVNVHIPFEGDLPETDASVAFNEIGDHAAHLWPDKDAEIVLYCSSGRMSAIAAEALAKLGYTRVHNLVGGFRAWSAAGHPMAESPQQ